MILLNDKEVKYGSFPNGESCLPIGFLNARTYNNITWVYEGDDEFFKLAMLKDYLDSEVTKSSLSIQYMPHSRMDRTNDNYATSLFPSARMINHMGFDVVQVVEPHSDVTPALIDRCKIDWWCERQIGMVLQSCGATSLFYPDAGAAKRYNYDMQHAIGHKQRDFKTGGIIDFDLTGDVTERMLIVDDLCSKGGTFVHSAKLLKEHGCKNVFLLVANCENTVFEGELFDHIDIMYTSRANILKETNKQIILI